MNRASAITAASETTAETTSAETTTEELYPFIKGGYWYYFDDESRESCAVSFEGNGKASIAYFNEENADGADAEYYRGSAAYSVDKDGITITKLPKEANIRELKLTVKDKKLLFGKKELEHHGKLTLDIVFNHFNG